MDIRSQTCVQYLEANRDGHGGPACGGIPPVQHDYCNMIVISRKIHDLPTTMRWRTPILRSSYQIPNCTVEPFDQSKYLSTYA